MSKPKDAKGAKDAEVISEELLESEGCRWVRLAKLTYRNDAGKEMPWECAQRTTRKSDVDAVFIVASVIYHNNDKVPDPKVLCVSQFRPPTESYILEFPAGLVDEGEDAETAALRELREETGFFGEVKSVSPVLFVDPGMTNANLKFVNVIVDCRKELNQNPKLKEDEGEFICTHLIPEKELVKMLREPKTIRTFLFSQNAQGNVELEQREHVAVSGLLFSYALGLAAQTMYT